MADTVIAPDLRERHERLSQQLRGSKAQQRYAQFTHELIERVSKAETERDEALAANELDRRNLHAIVSQIEAEITGRMWLIEGRGNYEWDDDRYREEFKWAVNAIQEKLEPLRKIAGDLKNSPTSESGVEAVRRLEGAEQENVALRAERDELAYWKKEQLAVEATWDDQAVGEELGVPLGASIRAEILPRIKALKDKVARLEAPVRNLIEHQYVSRPDPRGCNYPVGRTICGYERQEHVAARGREDE